MRIWICLIASLLLAFNLQAEQANPRVVLHTSEGDITLELYPDKAPQTVDNFLQYVRDGFYEGTIFHRVIKRFVVQGGGLTADMVRKPTRDPIVNEADNGLNNDRWTVAMARTEDPDSATSQFYINLRMNPSLDASRGKAGYTVFGKVIDGQYVVRAISLVPTGNAAGMQDVPLEPVLLNSAEILP